MFTTIIKVPINGFFYSNGELYKLIKFYFSNGYIDGALAKPCDKNYKEIGNGYQFPTYSKVYYVILDYDLGSNYGDMVS